VVCRAVNATRMQQASDRSSLSVRVAQQLRTPAARNYHRAPASARVQSSFAAKKALHCTSPSFSGVRPSCIGGDPPSLALHRRQCGSSRPSPDLNLL
jgi:hypothetical protein